MGRGEEGFLRCPYLLLREQDVSVAELKQQETSITNHLQICPNTHPVNHFLSTCEEGGVHQQKSQRGYS